MLDMIESQLEEKVIQNIDNAEVTIVSGTQLQIASEKVTAQIQNYSKEYLLELKVKKLILY
jgi:hypothetical protein